MKLSDKAKGIIIGIVIGTLVSGSAVVATSGKAKIDVVFKAMNFRVDGFDKKMSGTTPILYKGTTYVPMRFVGESLNWPVNYESASNTVWIGPKTVIARYNGGFVTRQELERQIDIVNIFNDFNEEQRADLDFQTDFLHQLLAHRLNVGKLDAANVKKVKTQAATELSNVKSLMKNAQTGKDGFAMQLQRFGVVEKDVLLFIENSLALRKRMELTLKEADIRKQYDGEVATDKDAFTTADVRHILIATESRSDEEASALADAIVTKLTNGEDFAALAEQYSDDPGSQSNGGLYTAAPVSNWVSEFRDAALTLELNKISEPVKTDYGYHVMRVEKRSLKTYSDVRSKVLQNMVAKKVFDHTNDDIPKLITFKDLKLK